MKSTHSNELDAASAASFLDQELPGHSVRYWHWFLTNNRRKDRAVAHRVPFSRVGRSTFYSADSLRAFARLEKNKRVARAKITTAEREPIGELRGRGFKWSIGGRQSVAGIGPVVLLKLTGLTVTLPLSPAQARTLAQQLHQYANRLDTKGT